VQRHRAAEAERQQADLLAVDPFDADSLVARGIQRNVVSPISAWIRSITGSAACRTDRY
jgi:hypothetical protein